jgi:hypothetical protein
MQKFFFSLFQIVLWVLMALVAVLGQLLVALVLLTTTLVAIANPVCTMKSGTRLVVVPCPVQKSAAVVPPVPSAPTDSPPVVSKSDSEELFRMIMARRAAQGR